MKKRILFILIAFILCFTFIGKANASTSVVTTSEDLITLISNNAEPGLIVKLGANITVDTDLDMLISDGDKTLDLNGYKLTVNGHIKPKWYGPNTLYITDSGENGTIISDIYNPINYQTNQDGNTAKLTINGGTFIVNYSDMFFTNCHHFIFTINDGRFKSKEDIIDTAGGFAPQITIKKLAFELITRDDRDWVHIGIDSAAPISDWLSTGSDLYYISSTGKALLRSNTNQGTKFKGHGSLLITNEPVTAYYLVAFHDYVGSNEQEQYLTAGQLVAEPEVEVPNGKTFLGWYTDENYTTKYSFSTQVYSDIDLYARWELTAAGSIGGETAEFATQTVGYSPVNSWSVPIFIDNAVTVDPARLQATLAGTNPEAFEFELDTTVGMMQGPGMWNTWADFHVGPKTGLEIGNYSAVLTLKYDQDNDGIYEVTIGTKTLLFKVIDKYTISFNSNGGSYVEPIKVGLNEGVTRPVTPEREGYVFDEWYTDPECTTPFSFGTTVESDMTLYAKWYKDFSLVTVTGIVKTMPYNGKYQTQTVEVMLNEELLVEDTDYTIEYVNNKNAGTATMIIKGIGDYWGQKIERFTITKLANPLAVKVATKTVKYTKVKKAKQVVKPITVTKWAGTVTYKKLSGSAKLTVNTKTGKVTVKKGTKKGTYKVKVKIMASGNTNYKSIYGYRTITVKVK